MKTGLLLLVVILVLLLGWWCYGKRPGTTFSGTLRDKSNAPIAGAQVSVGGETTVTDAGGRFTVRTRPAERDRWILEVRRPGFAPISKVLTQGETDIALTAVKATTQTFDAASAIVVKDVQANCVGSVVAGIDWSAHPAARFPQVIDAGGNRVTGAMPAAAREVLAFGTTAPPCSTGFQVSIPANSLVTASGQAAQGQVEVDVSTVDLYSRDGMPGDYTVAVSLKDRMTAAFMESFGAGTITIRQGNQTLQLKQGATAEIQIPVDRGQVDAGATPPATIPLLQYDGKTGNWQSLGTATLDGTRQYYAATVPHFSEFNADIIKTNPACVRFDAGGITGSFDLVITARTSSGGFKQVTRQVQPNAAQANPNLHAVYNLPPNDWVVLRAIKAGQPVGTWIVGTGGAWGGSGNPTYDYAACGATFSLSEAATNTFTFDVANRRFGPLPKHVAFLVKTTNGVEDVYPVGGTNCTGACSYLFSLFDTGANVVKLDNTLTGFMGVGLTPAASWDVDVRLNGYGVVAAGANPGAPFALPGAAGGAQAHSGELRIAPRNDTTTIDEQHTDAAGNPLTGFVPVNYMLTGSPVTNRVVARIDYTTSVTRGPWTFFANAFTVTGPDIRFFQPGDPAIPAPALTLFLEGFGSAQALNTGATDQRPFLQNVTLTNGTNRVFDDQTTSTPTRFFYDSATTFTVISQSLATALGAAPAAPNMTAGCSSNNTANFVRVTSIVIVGMNDTNQLGSYQANNVEVCVDVASSVITTSYPDPANPAVGRRVDAIIGANLFDQTKILWNGPRRTLGILR